MARFVRSVSRRGLLVLVVAWVIAQSTVPAQQASALRLGSDVWPPFTDQSGKTRLAIDLVQQACERAGIEAETSILAWTDVTAGLRSGDFDGSAAIWLSQERQEFLLFSEPYLENRLVLVGTKGSDVSAASLSDLAGKRVAVVEQYAYGESVDDAEGPVFVEGSSDQQNLQKLLAGEVDYMLVDELLIRYVVENQREEAGRLLQIGQTPLVLRPLYLALRRDLTGAESMVEKFNTEIRKMQADGTYNVILRLDWIRADVNGDGLTEFVPRDDHAGVTAPTTGYSILSSIPRESSVKLDGGYYIGGRVYKDWDSVPERYKAPPPSKPKDEPPPALLRF
jgi:ABC-type amino acid transport substrate-binding protein